MAITPSLKASRRALGIRVSVVQDRTWNDELRCGLAMAQMALRRGAPSRWYDVAPAPGRPLGWVRATGRLSRAIAYTLLRGRDLIHLKHTANFR